MADLQDHEKRIGALESEVQAIRDRINERIAAQSRVWQGDVADLKSDIATLRAEVAANQAVIVKQFGDVRAELAALPRVVADMIRELKSELPGIIGAELDKRSA